MQIVKMAHFWRQSADISQYLGKMTKKNFLKKFVKIIPGVTNHEMGQFRQNIILGVFYSLPTTFMGNIQFSPLSRDTTSLEDTRMRPLVTECTSSVATHNNYSNLRLFSRFCTKQFEFFKTFNHANCGEFISKL